MKAINLIKILFFFVAFAMISCQKDDIRISGEGPITTKTLDVANFSGLELAVAANVVVSQGARQEVTATGHANIIDRIDKKVSGDIWTIELDKGRYRDYELTINVTVPDLNSIYLSGSGHITINDFVNQSDLVLDLSGAGQIDLNTFSGTENMDIDISGSGIITGYNKLSSLREVNLRINGSGSYHGFPIMSDVCKVNISGSGTCQVSVRNTLEVSIGGSGTVYYKGNPSIKDHTNRAGNIVNAN